MLRSELHIRITYIALRLADSAKQKKENTKIHLKKIQATLEITGFEEPSQSGYYLEGKFIILLALPSLLAEKQPDISAGRPLMAIEVANEDVEFAVFVPVCYVDSTSVAFAEAISGQAYLFACLQFWILISPYISEEIDRQTFRSKQDIQLAVAIPIN